MAMIDDGETIRVVDAAKYPWIEVAQNYVAINGFKRYDFDPKSGILRLDEDNFVKGELERKIGLADSTQFVVIADIFIPDYGTRRIEGIRNIQYVPPEQLKVQYSQPNPTLPQIIKRNMLNIGNLLRR